MAEADRFIFSHKELVEIIVKHQNLTEGIWGLYLKFGIGAANIGLTPDAIQPAAIIPVLEIGLQKFEAVNNISVDAAIVNPKAGSPTLAPAKSKRRRVNVS